MSRILETLLAVVQLESHGFELQIKKEGKEFKFNWLFQNEDMELPSLEYKDRIHAYFDALDTIYEHFAETPISIGTTVIPANGVWANHKGIYKGKNIEGKNVVKFKGDFTSTFIRGELIVLPR